MIWRRYSIRSGKTPAAKYEHIYGKAFTPKPYSTQRTYAKNHTEAHTRHITPVIDRINAGVV